jgi:hypothetical protein
MDREQVVQDYRRRIALGERIKLTRAERAFLVDEFVGRLMGMTTAADVEAACRAELDLIEEGFGSGTNSAINYLSDYRKAVAAAVDAGRLPMTEETTVRTVGQRRATGEPFEAINHLAWSLLRYDNAVYLAAREETNRGNNVRQDHPQPFVPARFLAKAGELLDSSEAEALAVGIAALTGRRHTEVAVSGQFCLTEHPYVLQFRGQLKKGLVQTRELLAFSIGTLLPAIEVMAAIERFRAMPGVQQMAGRSSDDPLVVNFRARVNSRVKQHFQRTGILPLLPGFKSVSVHRLRAAYARLLVYFWLPNQGANEQRFLQFYLGHVEAELMATAANSGATNHYFGYRLVGEDDRPILASGVKLMAFPPLPNPTDSQITDQMRSNQQLDGLEGLEADARGEADESEALGGGATRAARADRGTTQEDQDAADAADHRPAELEESSLAPAALVAALAQLLDQLPVKRAKGGSGRLQTQLQPQQPVSAAQRGATPSTKPAAAQDEPGPLDDSHHQIHQPDQPAARSTGPAARSVASESTSQAAPAQTAPSDLPLAALLDQMQALQHQLSLSQAERHSIKLLSDQVEELKGQLQLAQQQRDQAQNQLQQVDKLQQENTELKALLADAQHRLDLFLNLAHGLPIRAAEQAAPATSEALQAPPGPPLSLALAPPVQTGALASSPSSAVAPLSPAHPVTRPQQQLQQPITTTPISDQPPATPPLPSFDDAQIKALTAGLSPDDRIPIAIQALVEFNQQCSQTKDRWTITGNVIAAMTSTNAATRVNPWLDIHPDVGKMIHHHNQEMGIDSNYHNRGKGKDKAQLRQILGWFLNQRHNSPTP